MCFSTASKLHFRRLSDAFRKRSDFTLQWHLTNTCGFHCRHCYDRSIRGELPLNEALRLLEDFIQFCQRNRKEPHLCFTGGDPLLYSGFWPLYEAAAATGARISILGNPTTSKVIERLQSIQSPSYYQVSLEGLPERNDQIRGSGHFQKVMEFLKCSRALGLKSTVMLTLSRENMADVLPLAESLRGLVSRFTFNRLAQVGEGVALQSPNLLQYEEFLISYLNARRQNPILGVKDNLFNILQYRNGRRLFPGCTGHGCGAAKDFVALLPDGEVHACRKFPSILGRIQEEDFETLYHSEKARRYRTGSTACAQCPLRKSCGGCLAVTFGRGLNPLVERDPDCFLVSQNG